MKNVLLAGTALLGLAFIATPASAELNLDLGGYFRGYAVYADTDVAGDNDFEFRRDTEVHVSGETTLDNGLTVGFHTEQLLAGNAAATTTDEAYAYFSGGWGRVNFGQEDGAAYLLQIAAPSADSNVDGLRSYISGVGALDYAHDDFRSSDKITYLTPKFNGFQLGASYMPSNNATVPGTAAMGANTGEFENAYEIAARWDGEFNGFGISAGAGFSDADANGLGAQGDLKTWNAGLNVAFNAFSVGAVYLDQDNSVAALGDSDTWVVGAAWDNGPYHVGVSYLDQDNTAVVGDTDRFTVGGGYTFGPGMTFRGALAVGEVNTSDFTQVTVGTDIQF